METQCKNEKRWNIVLAILYPILLAGALAFFVSFSGEVPQKISLFDFVLLSLATFRLIRLLVYDRIMQFVRDRFFQEPVSRKCPKSGLKASIGHLFGCPWCMGVWAGLFSAFFYYLTPLAWFPVLVLAVSGIASFVQVLANMIGWKSENSKTIAQNLHETKK
jgi:hypothetical protein